MNDKIDKQIDVISKLECESYKLSRELLIVKNEEQIAVSKKNDLSEKKSFVDSKLESAYQTLKEIISKGVIE
jgi:hypothetical protein